MTIATFILIVLLCFAVLLDVLATAMNISLVKQLQERLEALSTDISAAAGNQKAAAAEIQGRFEAVAEVLNMLYKQGDTMMSGIGVMRREWKEQSMHNLAILHAAVTNHHPDKDKNQLKAILLDPRAFNYLILTLYALNACRWAVQRSLADVCYWISAFAITATVTFLYKH